MTPIDKATPILFQDSLSGQEIKYATLEVVEPGGAYLDYKLTDVLISSVSDKGSAGDSLPQEQITLNFTKIEWDYTPLNADGSPGTPVSAIWNLRGSAEPPDPALAALAAPPSAGSTPFLAYLKLDGVDGESQDVNHKDWIDVFSYSEGVSLPLSVGSFTGGLEAGKVKFSDLTVLTAADQTTPILFQDSISGTEIKYAVLEVVEPNGEYLDYKLSDVLITSVSDKGNAGDSAPLEQVSLNFTKIEWDYTPLNADGSPGTPVSAELGTARKLVRAQRDGRHFDYPAAFRGQHALPGLSQAGRRGRLVSGHQPQGLDRDSQLQPRGFTGRSAYHRQRHGRHRSGQDDVLRTDRID